MRISEIYKKFQGEGIHAGLPAVFVRLQGCNVRCEWCDTPYALDSARLLASAGVEELAASAIEYRVSKLSIPFLKGWVCITGGEPLIQDLTELIGLLRTRSYCIEVFTNGTVAPPKWFDQVDSWVVDAKCPSTGVCGATRLGEWNCALRPEDSLKFTVADEHDLEWVLSVLNPNLNKIGWVNCNVLVSPVVPLSLEHNVYVSDDWARRVADFCVEHDRRLSLQIHKVLYGNKRGV